MDQKELTVLRLKLIAKWKEESKKRVITRAAVRNSIYYSPDVSDEEGTDGVASSSVNNNIDHMTLRSDDDCSGNKIIVIVYIIK
jgi:hypothetical protein